MIHLLESFGCGLCFALGVMTGIALCGLASKKDREAIAKELRENSKRIEDRLAVQVSAMLHILEETKKHNGGKDA
jgi:hypothetical protein